MKIKMSEEIKSFKEEYGYSDTDLTITQSSKIIDFWLGSWLKSLAIMKGAFNIEQKSDGVIELQNDDKNPNCMIYEVPLGGFVFTKASIPFGKDTPVSKTKKEMEMAFRYAENREKIIEKALKFYEKRYLIFIGIVFLVIKLIFK